MSGVIRSSNFQLPEVDLAAAMRACRNALIGVGMFSAVSNILMLTGSIFMLEVYDRVLPSRSVPTLIGLCVIAAFLFAMLGVLDLIRSRIMVRIGASLDEALSGRVYETLVRIPLKVGNRSDGLQPLRDLDNAALVPVRLRPDRVFRSALAAGLSRDLLRVLPFLDRHGRFVRRHHSRVSHPPDGNMD